MKDRSFRFCLYFFAEVFFYSESSTAAPAASVAARGHGYASLQAALLAKCPGSSFPDCTRCTGLQSGDGGREFERELRFDENRSEGKAAISRPDDGIQTAN